MKKFAIGLFAATVVFFGMTALAEETEQDVYFGSDNSVHIAEYNDVDGANYTTVLIRKAGTTDADGVVYVDQKSDGLGSVMNFMLKDDVEPDNYTATFGNSEGNVETINFKVGDLEYKTVTLKPENKMSVADEPTSTYGEEFSKNKGLGYYKKSFTFTTTMDNFDKFNSVYLVLADGTGQGKIELYDSGANARPSFTGGGELAFGIQIYNIPEEHRGMNLYLGEASE